MTPPDMTLSVTTTTEDAPTGYELANRRELGVVDDHVDLRCIERGLLDAMADPRRGCAVDKHRESTMIERFGITTLDLDFLWTQRAWQESPVVFNVDQINPQNYMTREMVLAMGMQIVPNVVSSYFPSNASIYRKLHVEPADIEGYLYEKVLMGKYVPLLEKHPTYYASHDCFNSSLYVACRNACMAHYRMFIKSHRRGGILRAQNVELDHEDSAGLISLATNDSPSYMTTVKRMLDACEDEVVVRILFFLSHERYDSKTALRKRFSMSRADFEAAWERMIEYAETWKEDLRDTPESTITIHSSRFASSI